MSTRRAKDTVVAVVIAMLGATAMATAQVPCLGDCNGNGRVSINELIIGSNISLELAPIDACPAFDANDNQRVSIGELIGGVNSSLDGCPMGAPTFAEVQEIFSANCLGSGCHSGNFPANGLSLEVGIAYDAIVGVTPFNPFAADDGLLRVDAGDPVNSYLLLKVSGVPPPILGSQMPLFAPPLLDAEMQLIQEWIAGGANP